MERRQWQPFPALRQYQENQLQRTIRQACEHVPYYRRLFRDLHLSPRDIRSVEDLKKLPLLSRETVRLSGRDMVAEHSLRQHLRPYSSSGSSGAPVTVYHGRDSNALEFVYYWRHWGWAGFRPGQHFAELQTIRFLQRKNLDDCLSRWQPHLGRLLLNSNRLGPAQAAAMAGEIRKHGCRFLKGLATTLAGFALACREVGVADLRFRAVFATGENLRPRDRALIETMFQSPVLDSYGQMERVVAISQCPQGGYHVNMDYGVLELEDLQPVDGGRSFVGRAVGTSLHNPLMPFIRYDLGDRIEVFAEAPPCPCRRTLPLIKAIYGRDGKTVITPDGNYLTSLYVLTDIMSGVDFIQYVQDAPDRLSLRIVPGIQWNPAIREQTLGLVRRAAGPSMDISIREVGFNELIRSPSGKIPCVLPYEHGYRRPNDIQLP